MDSTIAAILRIDIQCEIRVGANTGDWLLRFPCQFKRDEAFVTTQEVERNNQEYSTSSEEGNNNNTKIGKCVGEVAPSQNKNKCNNVLQESTDAKQTVGNNNNPPHRNKTALQRVDRQSSPRQT